MAATALFFQVNSSKTSLIRDVLFVNESTLCRAWTLHQVRTFGLGLNESSNNVETLHYGLLT